MSAIPALAPPVSPARRLVYRVGLALARWAAESRSGALERERRLAAAEQRREQAWLQAARDRLPSA